MVSIRVKYDERCYSVTTLGHLVPQTGLAIETVVGSGWLQLRVLKADWESYRSVDQHSVCIPRKELKKVITELEKFVK